MPLEVSEDLIHSFALYGSILVIKMLLMSTLTATQRFRKKAVSNPEDTVFNNGEVTFSDPDVERVRRAHLNDLENIPAFLIVGLLYCFTNPSLGVAVWIFRVFTLARFVHTLVYAIFVVRQPARALAYTVANVCTYYMLISIIYSFSNAF